MKRILASFLVLVLVIGCAAAPKKVRKRPGKENYPVTTDYKESNYKASKKPETELSAYEYAKKWRKKLENMTTEEQLEQIELMRRREKQINGVFTGLMLLMIPLAVLSVMAGPFGALYMVATLGAGTL